MLGHHHPIRLFFMGLLGLAAVLSAAEPPRPLYSIKSRDAAEDELIISDPAWDSKAPVAERETYLKTKLFPQVQADAAAGRQPAIWEIGFFYLNGWGVTRDLEKAEAAFRIGLQHKQGYGPWRMGYTYWEMATDEGATTSNLPALIAKAETWYRLALGTGFRRAAAQVTDVARAHLFGWYGLKPNAAAAESLQKAIMEVAPLHARVLLTRAFLSAEQRKFTQAQDYATQALTPLQQRPDAQELDSDFHQAQRFLAALKAGKLQKLVAADLPSILLETRYWIELDRQGRVSLDIHTKRTNGEKLSQEQKNERIRTQILPAMQAAAAAGHEPEIWEVGYVYLGISDLPEDLEKAQAAFRIGLQHGHGYGADMLARIYRNKATDKGMDPARKLNYFAQAESLYCDALAMGYQVAAEGVVELATAHLWGWWGLKIDPAAAERLLEAAGRVTPEDPSYLYAMAELRYRQKKFDQAYDTATRSLEGLRKKEKSPFMTSIYKSAKAIRFLSAVRSGQLAKLPQCEAMGMLSEQLDFLGPWTKAIPLLVVLELAGLVYWTYRARNPGPGWWLSAIWIGSAALLSGMGFLLAIPGFNHTAGRWFGAILLALAGMTNLWLAGPKRYLGSQGLIPRPWLKTGGILLAIMLGMLAWNYLYSHLYQWLMGEKLPEQLVAHLVHCENLGQLALLVLVAGVAIPFYEELFFRGYLYDAIERAWGGIWALALSSLIFALVHGLAFAPIIFALALALGCFRYRSGNLRCSILLHCINNTLAVILMYCMGS